MKKITKKETRNPLSLVVGVLSIIGGILIILNRKDFGLMLVIISILLWILGEAVR